MKYLLLPIIILILTSGCTHIPPGESAHDPYEETNRSIYAFNDALDKTIVAPAAECYVAIMPSRVRMCVTNFFDNLFYPNTVLNDFLQGKIKQGVADTSRLLINSTFGILGIFDPATEMGLEIHDEDFGQTLAVWGSGEGSYLMLPVLGPQTIRDTPDYITGYFTDPLSYVEMAVYLPVKIIDIINWRANMLESSKLMDETSIDRYLSLREFYRQNRINQIHDGNPPEVDIFDDDDWLDEEEDLDDEDDTESTDN